MLRKINENEFEQYIDFAYSLAMDLSKSAFPIYNDGVKDKAYFYEVAKRGIELKSIWKIGSFSHMSKMANA